MKRRFRSVHCCAVPAISLVLCVHAMADPANLVKDGSFEVGAGKPLPGSWKMTGGTTELGSDFGGQTEGDVSLKVQALPGRLAKLSQTLAVSPQSELLFTADVKSNGRIIATADDARMSYHQQGQWQKLAGLIRTGSNKTLTITFELSDLSGEAATARIDNVSVLPFTKPEALKRRESASRTALAQAGKPMAAIVYPSQPASYQQLARRLQQAILKKTGVSLPLVSDLEATETDAPNLKKTLAGQNLILIGRLGINRALWPAYNRFLDATDGYYPGGDGYVMRTAANVLHNGKNHIVLGGSSDLGALRAVETFIQTLDASPAVQGNLDLPYLLKTELGGECLKAMQANDAKWKAYPLDPTLPIIEPGYGTVRRWYENAMAYYWTGWDSYRQRAEDLLEPVLKDSTYPHHYAAEFFVRTYDMLDDSPLLEKRRAAVDRLIFENFCDVQTKKGDLTWMTTFSPPYDAISIVNRHQIAPWMADLTFADFLHDYFELPQQANDLVEFRRSEKDTFMRSVIQDRWGGSLPDLPVAEAEEETALSMLRFALERGEYALFNSGRGRQMLELDRINHLNGMWVRPPGAFDSKLMLGILASYYQDGRYLTLRQTLPSGKPFMNRYLEGIHMYSPGGELKPQNTDAFTGVLVPPVMPHRERNLNRLQGGKFEAPTFAANKAFEFGAFRSGFSPEDDYVSLTGVAGGVIPGIFTSFASRGTNWMSGGGSLLTPPSDRYFDQNAVSVFQTDKWQAPGRPYAAAAQLDWSANLQRSGGITFSMDPFVGTEWQRSVVWVRPGLYVVRDRLTAKQDGQFQISVNWLPAGPHTWEKGVWTSKAKTGNLRITPLGQGFDVPDPAADVLRQTAAPALKAGQPATSMTVLQARSAPQDAVLSAEAVGENAVSLKSQAHPEQNSLVVWSPKNVRGVTSDAQVVVIRPDGFQMLCGTYLEIDGKTLLKSPRTVSVTADWATGTLIIDNPQKVAELQLVGESVSLAAVPQEIRTQQVKLPAEKAPAEILARALRPDAALAEKGGQEKTLAADNRLPVQDDSGSWTRAWQYEGLRQPLPVSGARVVGPGIVDLGRVVDVAEIRFGPRGGAWIPRELPKEIWTAAGDEKGQMPPVGSPAWTKIAQPAEWSPGIHSGNYGEATPVDQDSQILPLKNVKARYIKANGIEQLQFLDRATQGSERPQTVRVIQQEGKQKLFLSPDFWPLYVGRPSPHDQVAMLTPAGQEIYKYSSPTNLQVAEPLPLDAKGNISIALATTDAKIRVLQNDGSVRQEIDLYALHQEFNKKYGRANTRQPVGGFTTPFAMGTWRQNSPNPELIVARYGYFSFIDLVTGQLKGVLPAVGYTQPAILPGGLDFRGNGTEEQVAMGRDVIRHLSGPLDERIEQPDGHLFFPQIYHDQRILEPASESHINGARPLLLQPVVLGQEVEGRPRFVAAARTNYFGFYDGLNRKWGETWAPLVSLRAATVMAASPKSLRALVATEDGLLWDVHYKDPLQPPSEFQVRRVPDNIRKISADSSPSHPALAGKALLVGERGLYLYDGQQALKKLLSGSFVDAQWADAEGNAIIAVQQDASVLRLERAPK